MAKNKVGDTKQIYKPKPGTKSERTKPNRRKRKAYRGQGRV